MIATARLRLRPFREGDDLSFLSDPEVVRFEPYPPLTESERAEALRARIGDSAFLAMEYEGAVIGNLYLGPRDFGAMELGYLLARPHWRRGLAKEAARTGFTPNAIRKTSPRGGCWRRSALRARRISAKTFSFKGTHAAGPSGRIPTSIRC